MELGMLSGIVMSAALIISVITDVYRRLIYNAVVFPGILLAIVFQMSLSGFSGALDALSGLAVGLGVLLIPYLMGGMGAGDVKLLAMVGAFKGVAFVLISAVYMAIIGALLALAFLICSKGAGKRLKALVYLIYGIRHGVTIPVDLRGMFTSDASPYGVAIAGGALCCVLL